jgi:hypothetical protein
MKIFFYIITPEKHASFPLHHMHIETWTLNKSHEKHINAFNTNAIKEFLRYHGLRKEQRNLYYINYKLRKVGY